MAEEDYYSSSSTPPQQPQLVSSDLQIRINGRYTFLLNQNLASSFSESLRKLIKQETRRRRRSLTTSQTSTDNNTITIEMEDFPGGVDGFSLIANFINSSGQISPIITVTNLPILHCAAVNLSIQTLLHLTSKFLEDGGIFHCTWKEILLCLKSCEDFLSLAESSGLLDQLVCTLLAKIAQNSTDMLGLVGGSVNSVSSPSGSSEENHYSRFFRVSESTNDSGCGGGGYKLCSTDLQVVSSGGGGSGSNKAWWFDDLSTLPPKIIEKVIKSLGAYGTENNSLLLTRFLLHYLKTTSPHRVKRNSTNNNSSGGGMEEYGGLADTAVYGVVLMGKTAFSSCRALFGVLRVVSGFGLSKECKIGIEKLIGNMLDQAKLDDLLISSNGGCESGVYDVSLVVRLIRVFVHGERGMERLQRVGRLIDQYLGEISPDQNLKVSRFIGVAQSLPDVARDCFDGVYRAIDIYLESHPSLSVGERSRLCGCLNYSKLSLETCKDLAKNPRIPPRVAVQALAAQQVSAHYYTTSSPSSSSTTTADHYHDNHNFDHHHNQHYYNELETNSPRKSNHNELETNSPGKSNHGTSTALVLYNDDNCSTGGAGDKSRRFTEESEDLRHNIEKMQWRVGELEKLCREMKGQMGKMVMMKHNKRSTTNSSNTTKPSPVRGSTLLSRPSPRLC